MYANAKSTKLNEVAEAVVRRQWGAFVKSQKKEIESLSHHSTIDFYTTCDEMYAML